MYTFLLPWLLTENCCRRELSEHIFHTPVGSLPGTTSLVGEYEFNDIR